MDTREQKATKMPGQGRIGDLDQFLETLGNEDRETLLQYCCNERYKRRSRITSHLALDDWIILSFVLWKAGVMDLRNPERDDLSGRGYDSYGEGGNHRITALAIPPFTSPFSLSPAVARLCKLNTLDLGNCISVPEELSTLENLECIFFTDLMADLFVDEKFPCHMELTHLKELCICESAIDSISPLFIRWISNQLPILESLSFEGVPMHTDDRVIQALRTVQFCFCDTLRELSLEDCCISEDQLKTLLLDVLPRFKNLGYLDVSWNGIESLQTIRNVIQNIGEESCSSSNSLVYLNLIGNECFRIVRSNDPEETEAVLLLFRVFKKLRSFSGKLLSSRHKDMSWHPFRYPMIMNDAGRCLIEDHATGVPLSTWPLLLERIVSERCPPSDRPTGVYYLLREGPALMNLNKVGTRGTFESDQNANTTNRPHKRIKVGTHVLFVK